MPTAHVSMQQWRCAVGDAVGEHMGPSVSSLKLLTPYISTLVQVLVP